MQNIYIQSKINDIEKLPLRKIKVLNTQKYTLYSSEKYSYQENVSTSKPDLWIQGDPDGNPRTLFNNDEQSDSEFIQKCKEPEIFSKKKKQSWTPNIQ